MNNLGLSIFEELRFVLELAFAIYPAIFIIFPKRNHFILRFILPFIGIMGCSVSYVFFFRGLMSLVQSNAFTICFSIFWYLFMTALIFNHSLFCFEVKVNDALLFTLGGYALQHISYVLINELVRFVIYPDVVNSLFIYFLLCFFTSAILYIPYFYFVKRFKKYNFSIMDSKASTSILLFILIVLLYASSFCFQNFFRSYSENIVPILSAIGDLFVSLMIVLVTILLEKIYVDKKDKDFIQALYEKEMEQYEIFKGSVEYINVKCHDLKHEIQDLFENGTIPKNSYEEINNSIKAYETNIQTGNEEMDIILSDVAIKCLNLKIHFSPLVDGKLMERFEQYDLYIFLSNVFDNALTYLSKVDEKNRYLSFIVKKVNNMLMVKQTNYLQDEEDVVFKKDGTIKTTKKDDKVHGFGTKSIQLFAKKYHGSIQMKVEKNEFILLLSFPL